MVGTLFLAVVCHAHETIHVHLPLKTCKVVSIEIGWHDTVDKLLVFVNCKVTVASWYPGSDVMHP